MTVLYLEALAATALSLSVLTVGAWLVQQRTGNSGWVDTIWTFSLGLISAPRLNGSPTSMRVATRSKVFFATCTATIPRCGCGAGAGSSSRPRGWSERQPLPDEGGGLIACADSPLTPPTISPIAAFTGTQKASS